jgi:hypothetical protein
MTPAAALAPAMQYAIVKDPFAIQMLKSLAPGVRDAINTAIDELQFNPHPPGHQPTVSGGHPALQLPVGSASPKHVVLYRVDEAKERIFVMFIGPLIFTEKVQDAAAAERPAAEVPAAELSDAQRTQLRKTLLSSFSEEDLITLCFDLEDTLGVTYDQLAGPSVSSKVIALIKHCERRKKVADLLAYCLRERPEADWPQIV